MNFLIDIFLAAVAVLIIIAGYRNGFVKSVLSLATTIVALVVACAFTPYLSDAICDGFLLEKVSGGIESTVASVAKSGDGYDFDALFTDTPEIMTQVLERYGVSEDSLEKFVSDMTETGSEAVSRVSTFIATPVVREISSVASFIVIFLVSYIILKIVSRLIELLFKAPVLKGADRLAGIIFGVVNAAIVLWALSLVISLGVVALGSVAPGWFGEDVLENSYIMKIFSKYNPIGIIKNVVAYKG